MKRFANHLTSDARFRLILIITLYGMTWSMAHYLDWALAWILAWFFQALILCGLLSVVHECAHAHRGLFGSTALNHQVGRFAAVLLGLNYSLYRLQHMRHHRYLHTPNDPEPTVELRTPTDYFQYLLVNPHFCLMSGQFLDAVLGRWDSPAFNGIDDKQRRAIQQDSYLLVGWILTVIALTFYMPVEMATIYLVPLALSLVLDGFISLPEHYGLGDNQDSTAGSRTILSNAFVRFILWNVNYHVEHHKHPGARFNELPVIHNHLKSNRLHTENAYLTFHWKLFLDLCKGHKFRRQAN